MHNYRLQVTRTSGISGQNNYYGNVYSVVVLIRLLIISCG